MTITELGSLGELVGAGATVATLLYLAIQIRANTKMMNAQSDHARHQLSSQINVVLAQDPQLAGVFRRGLESFDALEPDEQVQFTFTMAEFVHTIEMTYTDTARGVCHDATFESAWRGIQHLLASPGGSAYWKLHSKRGVSPAFKEFVDRELRHERHFRTGWAHRAELSGRTNAQLDSETARLSCCKRSHRLVALALDLVSLIAAQQPIRHRA